MNERILPLLNPATKKTVMLAVDHGYFQGPTTGLENPAKLLQRLGPYCDAISPTKGILYHCMPRVKGQYLKPIILRASGGNSMVYSDPVEMRSLLATGTSEDVSVDILTSRELANEGLTVSVKEALRLGVAGVSVSIYVGSKYQRQTIENLARLVDETRETKLMVLGITAVGKELKRDARYLALASRIAAEHGADMVKTYYCEDFEKVVETCFVPVVIAGGKKLPELEALQMCSAAMQAGAIGVDMGRNIFQSVNPVAMIRAVNKVVHENFTPQDAFEFFENQIGKRVR